MIAKLRISYSHQEMFYQEVFVKFHEFPENIRARISYVRDKKNERTKKTCIKAIARTVMLSETKRVRKGGC